MGGRVDAFRNEAMRLIEHHKKRLQPPADRQGLRPKQHVVDDPQHRADDGWKNLRRQSRDVEYRYRLVVSDPIPDKCVEVVRDLSIQVGLVAAAGREKERKTGVLEATSHEVELPLKV